jgi:hypothetical protein
MYGQQTTTHHIFPIKRPAEKYVSSLILEPEILDLSPKNTEAKPTKPAVKKLAIFEKCDTHYKTQYKSYYLI